MKHLILKITALLFLSNMLAAQNLIDNSWRFSTGDNMAWKEEAFDASTWKTLKAGSSWEKQGYPTYNGYAWYLKKVTVPIALQKTAMRQGGLVLHLGAVDDADELYFNGELLGATGKFPPNYVGAYDAIRKYEIPANKVHFGKENTIAVRVYDESGDGGLMSLDTHFKVKGVEDNIKVSTLVPVANHIFLSSNDVKLNLVFNNMSTEKISGKLTAYVISDFNDTIHTISSPILLHKKKKFNLPIALKNVKPGFYSFEYTVASNSYNVANRISFGVEPEKIVSPRDTIYDLANFWMRAKRELAAVDPQFKLIRKDSLCTDKRDVYLVEMRSLENVLIRGWYARPKAAGKFPAILHVQGYSSNQQMSWGYKEADMAVMVLNVRGHGNSKDNVNPGFPGYLQYSIKDKEKYIYRGAYMDCVRAVDFLCSRPEVDTSTIVVAGGSQGGAFSIATAALDNRRIKLCMPDVPFLSDFPDYFKVAKWPANEFADYVNTNPTFGWDGVFETLKYFDIKNLAPWVKCPVFMQVGLKDTTCPPHINFAAYNQLNVPKSYIAYPESGHGLPSQAGIAKYAWMKQQLAK